MATQSPSAALRAQLRDRMLKRIDELGLKRSEAAAQLGCAPEQVSRLRSEEDIFTLDRLIDAADGIGITVRMRATRPYRGE